jgi:hypothetical protein
VCRRERDRALQRARDARPLSSTLRGYGAEHRKLRSVLAKVVASGKATCSRYGAQIRPDEPFDLAHDGNDRSLYTGVEHRRCNRATSGRKTRPPARRHSRKWVMADGFSVPGEKRVDPG